MGELDEHGRRNVIFDLNGFQRVIRVQDQNVKATMVAKKKANDAEPGSVGAPMPGVVLEVRDKDDSAFDQVTSVVWLRDRCSLVVSLFMTV